MLRTHSPLNPQQPFSSPQPPQPPSLPNLHTKVVACLGANITPVSLARGQFLAVSRPGPRTPAIVAADAADCFFQRTLNRENMTSLMSHRRLGPTGGPTGGSTWGPVTRSTNIVVSGFRLRVGIIGHLVGQRPWCISLKYSFPCITVSGFSLYPPIGLFTFFGLNW